MTFEQGHGAVLEKRGSVAGNTALLIGSWLVPGLGFVAKRQLWRGLTIFILINGTFVAGLLLHGAVLVPEFNYRSPSFNIVNLLTFVGQLGNGGASLVSLADEDWKDKREKQARAGKVERRPRIERGLFPADERHAWFDLASLYLLVAGCMNYFSVVNFYDRYLGRHGDAEPESGEE